MLSPGIFIDNTNNYGIVKTEAVFGFNPKRNGFMNMNSSSPFEWLLDHGNFGRSFTDKPTEQPKKLGSKNKKAQAKGPHKKKHSTLKKCINKLLKGKKKKIKHLYKIKKYIIPLIIGFLAAKSVLIPVALKALAFISFKAILFISLLKLIK